MEILSVFYGRQKLTRKLRRVFVLLLLPGIATLWFVGWTLIWIGEAKQRTLETVEEHVSSPSQNGPVEGPRRNGTKLNVGDVPQLKNGADLDKVDATASRKET